jgi:hypothetical protein
VDPNARWVEQCDGVAYVDDWRGTITSTGGRWRGNATSTVSVSGWFGDVNPDNADGYCEATVETFAVATSEVGVALRIQSTNAHYLCITTFSGTATIYKYTGSFTSLASTSITVPVAPFTIRGDIRGDMIRMFVNGALVLSIADSSFVGPGNFGVYMFPVTSVANVEIGRWEYGALPGPFPVRTAGQI